MHDLMNNIKTLYNCIDDFSIQSSNLEQLFLQFARTPNQKSEFIRNNLNKPFFEVLFWGDN